MRSFAPKLLHVSNGQATALEPVDFSGRFNELTLEQWIVAQPALVGEPLLVLGHQLAEFEEDRDRLDILALDKAGEVVLIELKVTEDFRVTDLQALAYAAAYAARTTDELAQTLQRTLANDGDADSASDARTQIVDFLELDEFAAWEPSKQVRLKLVAPAFPRRVLKTVKWLGDVYGMPIEAISARLFEDGNGSHQIAFERLLPLPGENEFDMTIKQREAEKRSRNSARRGSVLPLLLEAGEISHGDKLWVEQRLLPLEHRDRYDPDAAIFQAIVHAEDGSPPRLLWRPSTQAQPEPLAPSGLVYRIYEELFPERGRAFFATAVASTFKTSPDGMTLEELALEAGVWAEPDAGS